MPSAYKSKGKGRDARQSRSRNTTPSNTGSAPTAVLPASLPSYLEKDVAKLIEQANGQYAELLDLVAGPNIPDSKTLETLVEHLKSLSDMADNRGDACNAGMREMSQKRKEVLENQDLSREVSVRSKLKRESDEEEDPIHRGKTKKRKERSSKEERSSNNGTHDSSRQDGAEAKVERAASPLSKNLKKVASEGSSSLSPPSMMSPNGAAVDTDGAAEVKSPGSDSSESSPQPEPQPAVPQVQIFGDNPLKFDDPTIYHIRDIVPGMTDDEKKEIYSVTVFPKSDLAHMMAGKPPDQDYVHAKPTNQVSANTFQAYIEPFIRPLMEEDIAWLKERGDRVTPFINPRRGKKHYRQIWAEEDGMHYDQTQDEKDQLPLNQGRGSIEQLTDDKTENNEVSIGPLLSRLCTLLRYEHRTLPDENAGSSNDDAPNGSLDAMDIDPPPASDADTKPEGKPLPPATAFRDASPTGFKTSVAKLDHAQLDERAKAELRYIGFLGADDNPDYDAHYDDEVAERLRLLQGELKKQVVTNNARKARILHTAQEHMAMQEFTTIQDDLDSQVQQAYLKRTRTMGKSKKGAQAKNRPGAPNGVASAGVSRPAVGDAAKIVMDRRKRWNDAFLPIFEDIKTSIPKPGETIFDPDGMIEYEKAELEAWDEE
ncbi:hypothetical protein N7495_005090 [Penicillium taxi]|uniref:uncharacterized protein n=1 Tax=Penicillium taxi TaxID=168475 RepID=UPI002545B292|nr:uncharacterized protein N7495_005090 [Penicillium taxi]KAJ5893399.1 hypothetical protein N7495_005090 [Penicillium taxi]